MQGDVNVDFVGNLTAAPELRFTASGAAVANFTVACTPRKKNPDTGAWEDGDATFMRCTVWRQFAENMVELAKGDRVFVQGRLTQRSYDTAEGERRTVYEVQVDNCGPDMRFRSATVNRVARDSGGGQQQQRRAPANDDPWASPPSGRPSGGGFSDEPPF